MCNAQLSQTIANLIAAINALFEADYAIRFRDFYQQHYGFDSLMYQPMVDDYNFLTVANQPYRVAWKSVEAGRTDSVLLLTPFAQLPDSLHFETNSRTPVPHHEHACGAGCADNGAAILPVTGGEHNKTYQIYPVQTRRDSLGNPERKYAGKLNVISYNRKNVEVVLVPVNGAGSNLSDNDVQTIQTQLNEIYQPAITSFSVERANHLTVSGFTPPLSSSATIEMVADYNASMNKIRKALFQSGQYHSNKYFILLVSEFDQSTIRGYMPLGRNIGFVATVPHAGNIGALSRTIAHELGHGAFTLKHTWEEYPDLEENSTSNLMDKGNGTGLQKFQWDLIHNPRPTRPIFHTFEQSMSDVDEFELWLDDFLADIEETPTCPTNQGGTELRGSTDFISTMTQALSNLYINSNAGKELVERALSANDKKLLIFNAKYREEMEIGVYKFGDEANVMKFNLIAAKEHLPAGQGVKDKILQQYVYTTLGHELAHHNGPINKLTLIMIPPDYKKELKPHFSVEEIYAVKMENRLRKDKDLPLRTYYGGHYVYKKKGELLPRLPSYTTGIDYYKIVTDPIYNNNYTNNGAGQHRADIFKNNIQKCRPPLVNNRLKEYYHGAGQRVSQAIDDTSPVHSVILFFNN